MKKRFYVFRSPSSFFCYAQCVIYLIPLRGMAPAAPIPFSRSAQSDLRVCSFLSSLGKKETDGGRASPAEESD